MHTSMLLHPWSHLRSLYLRTNHDGLCNGLEISRGFGINLAFLSPRLRSSQKPSSPHHPTTTIQCQKPHPRRADAMDTSAYLSCIRRKWEGFSSSSRGTSSARSTFLPSEPPPSPRHCYNILLLLLPTTTATVTTTASPLCRCHSTQPPIDTPSDRRSPTREYCHTN